MNTVDSKKSRHVYATMNIVGEKMMPVRFQLDSGEACNIWLAVYTSLATLVLFFVHS
jgi:hypothetical protein